ncbi:MAG: hypothetical protein ACJ8EB_08530, partial [Allosphingosinicella sp.]
AAGGFTPGQRLLLVSLLQEWPLPLSKTIEAALRRDGLVARRTKPRRYKGRTHAIEEARLTGRGEEEAKRLWDSLGRDERAQLRAQAMRSGL